MTATKKSCSLLLIFLVASSLLLLQTASATTKPSTPQFTVTYIDTSYNVPPTYGTDEFTGKTVVKQTGYHVDEQSVVFKIKNQPFTTYNDSSGNTISLYYNFRYRGHYGTVWKYYPFSETGYGTVRYGCTFYRFTDEEPKIPQLDCEYTEKALTLGFLFGENKPSVGSQVDFQVQAIVGHIDYAGDGYYTFVGQAGDWSSNIETLTIGSGQTTTASPNPAPQSSNDTVLPTLPTETPLATPTQSVTTTPTANPVQSGTQNMPLPPVDWQTIIIVALVVTVAFLAIIVVLQQKSGSRKT
jgi:hypothetical protein